MIPHWIADILLGLCALGSGVCVGLWAGIKFKNEELEVRCRLLQRHLTAVVVPDERLCGKPCQLCLEEREELMANAREFLQEVSL